MYSLVFFYKRGIPASLPNQAELKNVKRKIERQWLQVILTQFKTSLCSLHHWLKRKAIEEEKVRGGEEEGACQLGFCLLLTECWLDWVCEWWVLKNEPASVFKLGCMGQHLRCTEVREEKTVSCYCDNCYKCNLEGGKEQRMEWREMWGLAERQAQKQVSER